MLTFIFLLLCIASYCSVKVSISKGLGMNGEDTMSKPWRNSPLIGNPGCTTGYTDERETPSDRLMMISLPPKSELGVDWSFWKKIMLIQCSSSLGASYKHFMRFFYLPVFCIHCVITSTTLESQISVVFTLMIPASNVQLSPLRVICGLIVDGLNSLVKIGSSVFPLEIRSE